MTAKSPDGKSLYLEEPVYVRNGLGRRIRELRADALEKHTDNATGWFWVAVENLLTELDIETKKLHEAEFSAYHKDKLNRAFVLLTSDKEPHTSLYEVDEDITKALKKAGLSRYKVAQVYMKMHQGKAK